MPTSSQNKVHTLNDMCDTLEALAIACPGSRAAQDVVYSVDKARLLTEDSLTHLAFSQSVWELVIRGDALMRSPDLPKDSEVATMMQGPYTLNLASVSTIIASNDIAMWNHIIDDLVAKRDFSAVREHAYRHLPFMEAVGDNEIYRREAVGGLLNNLSDVVGEGAVPSPAPNELFNLRLLRIVEDMPDAPGKPVVTTITYKGDPLITLKNPALPHPDKGVVAPLDNLTLATIARNVFYKGDSSRGIPPMVADHSEVEQRIIEALDIGRQSSSPSVQDAITPIAVRFKSIRKTQPQTPEAPVCAPGM